MTIERHGYLVCWPMTQDTVNCFVIYDNHLMNLHEKIISRRQRKSEDEQVVPNTYMINIFLTKIENSNEERLRNFEEHRMYTI